MSVEAPRRVREAPREPPGVASMRTRGVDLIAVAGLALLALFLQPALHAAIRADDTWTSEERGIVAMSGGSLLDHLWGTAVNFYASGRPSVLGTTQGLTTSYLIGDHRVLYHALLLVLTVVAAGLLYALVRELGLSRAASFLTMVLLAGAIQLRSYHDPVLGYWGTTQMVLILVLASLLVFVRALRLGGRHRLLWSLVLFVPAPLLYEAAYPLVGLHFGVALLERRGRAAWKASAPFLAIGIGFVFLSLYARATGRLIVPGYEVGSSPLAALRTYVIQLATPIPASNILFQAPGTFIPLGLGPTKAELLAGAWRGAAVFAVVLLVSLHLAAPNRLRLPCGRTLRNLAVIGGLLWATSAVVISAAPKYQLELGAGKGHLPALFQVFGWALVAVAGLLAALRGAAGRSVWAVRFVAFGAAGLFGIGAAFTGYNNTRVIALETPIAQARDLLENATQKGTFAQLPERSTLIFQDRDLHWQTGNWGQVPESIDVMIFDRGGRQLDARLVPTDAKFGCSGLGKFPPQDCEALFKTAAWVSVRDWRGGGTVVVAPFEPAHNATTASNETPRELRAFVQSDSGEANPPQLIGLTSRRHHAWSGRSLSWRRVEKGDDWAIYETRVTAGPRPLSASLDDSRARMNFAAPPPSDQIVRLYGTKRLLP